MKRTTTRGKRRHLVTLQNPGTPVPDGDGGFTEAWTALVPPTLYVSIEPATARDLERMTAGTVMSLATHIICGDFHSGVTSETRILFGTRTFAVTGIHNLEERNIEMELTAVEIVA